MCGFCREKDFVLSLTDETYENFSLDGLNFLNNTIRLMETDNFASEIGSLNDSIKKMYRAKEASFVYTEIICCRTMQILMTGGFNNAYWNILKNPVVQWAIDSSEDRASEVHPKYFPYPFHDELLLLYGPDIFYNEWTWDLVTKEKSVPEMCVDTLTQFVDWWLRGKWLMEGVPVNKGDCVGIKRNPDEWRRFKAIYRPLFYSVQFLSQHDELWKHVIDLVTNDSVYLPTADGLDLWLQRVAIVNLIKKGRAAYLEPLADDIRSLLKQYAAAKTGVELG